MKIELLPPRLYQAFIVLMILSHSIFPIYELIPKPYRFGGIIIFIVGAWFAIRAKRLFKQTQTPMNPSAKPTQLHKLGFFRISRNPMYLGITAGLFGIAIFLGTIMTFVFPILFLLIMNYEFVPVEEQKLESVFGEEFRQYRNEVRRWI